jgi:hypothetical protein
MDAQLQKEIQSIRALMEKSTKFISLSGFSGILMGIYALLGTGAAHYFLNDIIDQPQRLRSILIIIGIVVLVASLITAYFLSAYNAKKHGQRFQNAASIGLLQAMIAPLFVGGLVCIIAIYYEYFNLIVPFLLIFYGLALHAGGNYTFRDIRSLSYLQILLGLLAFLFPGYDLFFWSLGFGFLHVIYGCIMYYKYERVRRA